MLRDHKGRVEVHCESEYFIKCLDKLIPTWIQNDWKTSTGSVPVHRDLLLKLFGVIRDKDFAFFDRHGTASLSNKDLAVICERARQHKLTVRITNEKQFEQFMAEIEGEDYLMIFTDGSCLNNGKPNAAAGYGIHFPNKEFQ